MLMGPDGKLLYDSSTKQWNASYLPPILRSKPLGLQECPERLYPTEEEKELSTFMTTLMDALISYYKSTPTSVPQGMEASFAATTTPTAPILDTSPLLHSSSGSHSDPGAPTIPQGTEVSSPNNPAPDPLSLPLNTVGAASTPGTTFIPAESIFDTSPPLLHSSSSGLQSDPGAPTLEPACQPTQGILRNWSSAAATKPLAGGIARLKPDSMLVWKSVVGATQNLDWGDVLMTAELTSKNAWLELTSQIECKALAMFDVQPNRVFSYLLAFCNGQYHLYMYDRAGGVYSHWYDLHESPIMLLHILCAAAFAPTSWLGIDDTFNCRLHPVITIHR
ncbi:hypothetical protein EDD15DRAFT_2375787 [Pisolithus albus]|nr:hypothetical protein EDD15DRAFT_2375787 [Pisolithus albus]